MVVVKSLIGSLKQSLYHRPQQKIECCYKPSFQGSQSQIAEQLRQKLKQKRVKFQNSNEIFQNLRKVYEFKDENFVRSAIYHSYEMQELSRNVLNCLGIIAVLQLSNRTKTEDLRPLLEQFFANATIQIDLNKLLEIVNSSASIQIESTDTLLNTLIGWIYLDCAGDFDTLFKCLWSQNIKLKDCVSEGNVIWTPENVNRYPFLENYGAFSEKPEATIRGGTVLAVLETICEFPARFNRLILLGDSVLRLYAYQFLLINNFTQLFQSKIQDTALDTLAEDLKVSKLIEKTIQDGRQVKQSDVVRCLVGAMFVASGNVDKSCQWMQATAAWLPARPPSKKFNLNSSMLTQNMQRIFTQATGVFSTVLQNKNFIDLPTNFKDPAVDFKNENYYEITSSKQQYQVGDILLNSFWRLEETQDIFLENDIIIVEDEEEKGSSVDEVDFVTQNQTVNLQLQIRDKANLTKEKRETADFNTSEYLQNIESQIISKNKQIFTTESKVFDASQRIDWDNEFVVSDNQFENQVSQNIQHFNFGISLEELIKYVVKASNDDEINRYCKYLLQAKLFQNYFKWDFMEQSVNIKRSRLCQLPDELTFEKNFRLIKMLIAYCSLDSIQELSTKCGVVVQPTKTGSVIEYYQYLDAFKIINQNLAQTIQYCQKQKENLFINSVERYLNDLSDESIRQNTSEKLIDEEETEKVLRTFLSFIIATMISLLPNRNFQAFLSQVWMCSLFDEFICQEFDSFSEKKQFDIVTKMENKLGLEGKLQLVKILMASADTKTSQQINLICNLQSKELKQENRGIFMGFVNSMLENFSITKLKNIKKQDLNYLEQSKYCLSRPSNILNNFLQNSSDKSISNYCKWLNKFGHKSTMIQRKELGSMIKSLQESEQKKLIILFISQSDYQTEIKLRQQFIQTKNAKSRSEFVQIMRKTVLK